MLSNKERLNYLKDGGYRYESKDIVEIFKVLVDKGDLKVCLKVINECFAKKPKAILPREFVEVFKILAERKRNEIDLEMLKRFKKLNSEELESKEYVEIFRILVENEEISLSLMVAKICVASLKFAGIFKILISKDDKDIDSEILKKLKELGRKSVYEKN
jgi:hypothetical protein